MGLSNTEILKGRFFLKVNKTETCWLWKAAKYPTGYGQMWDGERVVPAHRLSYELFVSPIPEGLHIDHMCHVRACVNPSHLRTLTPIENVMEGNIQIKRTHCPLKHPYDAVNTYRYKTFRTCRECKRIRDRKYSKIKVGKRKEYFKLRYASNKNVIAAQQKEYYEKNKERILARQKRNLQSAGKD